MAACVYCQQGADHKHVGQCSGCDMFMMLPDPELVFQPNDLTKFYCFMCQSWFLTAEKTAEYFCQFFGTEGLKEFYSTHFPTCNTKEDVKSLILADFSQQKKMEYFNIKGFLFKRHEEIRQERLIRKGF